MWYPTTLVETLGVHETPTVCEVCCTPVPETLIFGELLALLFTATLPVTAPALIGANVTVSVVV